MKARGRQTKSRAVAEGLLRAIREGAYPDGRLPGRRELESQFRVSRPTVESALAALERDGWIRTGPRTRPEILAGPGGFEDKLAGFLAGSGFREPSADGAFARQDLGAGEGADSGAVGLSTLCDEHWDGHLNADIELSAVVEALRLYRKGESRMFATAGSPELREAVCAHAAKEGIRATPDEVFIVSRRLQAYRALSDVLLGRGTELWYPAVSLIRFYGVGERHASLRRELAVSEAGEVDLDPFLASGRRRVLMLEPEHAKPLGGTVSEPERRTLAEAARRSGALVVEDGYCRLMYENPPAPIAAFDPGHESVIHIGALPVWLTPLGCFNYIIANARLVRLLRAAGRRDYLNPGILSQLAGERIFATGRLEEMLRRFRPFHEKRIREADAVLREAFGGRFSWRIPSGFGCVWLDLGDTNLRKLYRTRRAVDFQPGWFYGEKDARHALLRYTMPIATFREGVARLRAAIDAL